MKSTAILEYHSINLVRVLLCYGSTLLRWYQFHNLSVFLVDEKIENQPISEYLMVTNKVVTTTARDNHHACCGLNEL